MLGRFDNPPSAHQRYPSVAKPDIFFPEGRGAPSNAQTA
jgi:hypothetical protein